MNNEKPCAIFCENIKWLRELYKFSTEEMALILGVQENSVVLIERGMIPPQLPFAVLTQLQEHFDASPELVFSKRLKEENA